MHWYISKVEWSYTYDPTKKFPQRSTVLITTGMAWSLSIGATVTNRPKHATQPSKSLVHPSDRGCTKLLGWDCDCWNLGKTVPSEVCSIWVSVVLCWAYTNVEDELYLLMSLPGRDEHLVNEPCMHACYSHNSDAHIHVTRGFFRCWWHGVAAAAQVDRPLLISLWTCTL